MTDEIAALIHFIESGVPMDHFSIRGFYEKWQKDSLAILKWFNALAAHSPKEHIFERLELLEQDPLFQKTTPNFLRALYLQFARSNLTSFHARDGKGYRYLGEKIKWIDQFNPNVASRAASAFSMLPKLDPERQSHIREVLRSISQENLSRDTYEVISKYLAL